MVILAGCEEAGNKWHAGPTKMLREMRRSRCGGGTHEALMARGLAYWVVLATLICFDLPP